MREVTSENAADYLRDSGRLTAGEPVEVRELAGGVSNIVLLVTLRDGKQQFVLKQARGRLRVKEEWLCPVERIWREVEVLRACGEMLAARSAGRGTRSEQAIAAVPQLLWEDRDNYLYAMTAAPANHTTWKERLLAGEVESSLAQACGQLLGQLHASSWAKPATAARFDDRTYFDQLRLDPYYRQIACVHADLAPAIDRLIESVWNNRRCLVHGDFSPKNLLVWPGNVMLIDFEVGHYGDPAFDLGFFLTHLVLKSIWSGSRLAEYLGVADVFWQAYRTALVPVVPAAELVALEQRMLMNLAGCMLARVDGKSPVDYLTIDQQALVRGLARAWLFRTPVSWNQAAGLVLSREY